MISLPWWGAVTKATEKDVSGSAFHTTLALPVSYGWDPVPRSVSAVCISAASHHINTYLKSRTSSPTVETY